MQISSNRKFDETLSIFLFVVLELRVFRWFYRNFCICQVLFN